MQDPWEAMRHRMVSGQIEARGIRDPLVLDAFRSVERHRFVPERLWPEAYEDHPLPIGEGQTISQPYMVALMTEALRLRGKGEKILEVGTGSGYQAAILAHMGCVVHTIERNEPLAATAARRLAQLGFERVFVHVGDGSLGLADEAPFRGIIVTAGGPRVPPSLKSQLDPEGGVLVLPVGNETFQSLLRVTRHGEDYRQEDLGGCRFVPLVGEEAWSE